MTFHMELVIDLRTVQIGFYSLKIFFVIWRN